MQSFDFDMTCVSTATNWEITIDNISYRGKIAFKWMFFESFPKAVTNSNNFNDLDFLSEGVRNNSILQIKIQKGMKNKLN